MQYKRINTSKELENGAMNYGMKKAYYLHYLTSTKSFIILVIFFS